MKQILVFLVGIYCLHNCVSLELSSQVVEKVFREIEFLRSKVEFLEETVRNQDKALTRHNQDSLTLEEIVKKQGIQIYGLLLNLKKETRKSKSLEDRLKSLELKCNDNIRSNPKDIESTNPKHVYKYNQLHYTTNNNSSIRKERLLLQNGGIESSGIIAFYAYKSVPINNPGVHQTLIFDVLKTNIGGGYNHADGIFTAPRNGVYVFTLVIRINDGEHPTELMVYNQVYGATFLRARNGDDGSVSGTVVAQINQGDVVFVRIHSTYNGDGYKGSTVHGHPSFSGWILN